MRRLRNNLTGEPSNFVQRGALTRYENLKVLKHLAQFITYRGFTPSVYDLVRFKQSGWRVTGVRRALARLDKGAYVIAYPGGYYGMTTFGWGIIDYVPMVPWRPANPQARRAIARLTDAWSILRELSEEEMAVIERERAERERLGHNVHTPYAPGFLTA